MKIIAKKISKSDLIFALRLRNIKSVRNNFFNTEIITIKDHKKWFLNKINNKKDLFLIIKKNRERIGIIRYEKKEFYYDISISILPKYHSQNLGSIALTASEVILKKGMLISNIKKSNKKSLAFFIKNGYALLSNNKRYVLYKVINKKQSIKSTKLINQIQEIRKKNNVNWMDILRIAFETSPDKTKSVFKNIFKDDKSINLISKKLFS